MSALTAIQRAAILARYGSQVRTYFSQSELEEARFTYQPRLDATAVEFHDYLRLSIVLAAGRRLPRILRQTILAPSFKQERELVESRGQIEGQLDVRSYLRRRGQLTTPRTFPVWRVKSSYDTPENRLAAASAHSLLAELQALASRLPIMEATETQDLRAITDAIERLLRDPALGETSRSALPDIASESAEGLFARVAQRWQTRRISNTAYMELWRWADGYRKKGLGEDGLVVGLAYSETFDNRLFEIFALGAIRDGLAALGFAERVVRPLHERNKSAVLEVEQPESHLRIAVFFQKGDNVVWSTTAPRELPGVSGVPDIALVPSSTRHPVIIIDAKNRDRGSDLDESISDELYKMFGYFHNFGLRMQVHNRGPFGVLVFLGKDGSGVPRRYASRSGGVLIALALDPCDTVEVITQNAVDVLTELLRAAGLFGGQPKVASELQSLKEAARQTAAGSELTPIEEETLSDEVLNRIHDLVAAQYGTPGEALLQARQSLELHLLGSAWVDLDEDVQSLLATGEVFWAQHHLAFGMDFAPVVVELARAMEVSVNRMLFEPFRRWAATRQKASGPPVLTLGQMRVMVQNAKESAAGLPRKPDAEALNEFLTTFGLIGYAYGELISDLDFVNRPRRRAAHKDVVTGAEAGQLRERMLGVGAANPILANLVVSLGPLKAI